MGQSSSRVSITSVAFENFKSLAAFRVHLQEMNILVGGNNAGKSTVIAAFRVLAAALRAAGARGPEFRPGPGGKHVLAWSVSEDQMPMSVENVQTDYNDRASTVTFTLSNGNRLLLWFPVGGGCLLVPAVDGLAVRTAAAFRAAFPLSVGVVPVLGPVEHQEAWVEKATVQRNLATHRASRNFRNYWHHFPEDFGEFASLVKKSWKGMDVHRPERFVEQREVVLRMFCGEDRIDRELYWIGFGFQIWCQLLTHMVRNRGTTLLVLDEPETYLHPDVQRRLVGLLRDLGPSVLMATHSSEIIAEAEPDELLLIQRGRRSARRIGAAAEVQSVLEAVGSIQNPTLTRLARTRRVLFVEGEDFRLLARFARKLGLVDLADGVGFTVVPIGGFGNWEKVAHLGWGIAQTLGQPLALAIVLDRDYRPDDEIDEVRRKLSEHLQVAHLHSRKEIENYLLDRAPLQRAIDRMIARGRAPSNEVADAGQAIMGVTEALHDDVFDQFYARREARMRRSGRDSSTVLKEIRREFAGRWGTLEGRIQLAPGKKVLRLLNARLQSDHGFAITEAKIVDAFHVADVPDEIRELLVGLDAFRQRAVGAPSGEAD